MIRALLFVLLLVTVARAEGPPLVLSNAEIAQRLGVPTPEARRLAEQRKRRPGETDEQYKARRKAESKAAVDALRKRDDARRAQWKQQATQTKNQRMVDQWEQRQANQAQAVEEYNAWARAQNELISTYNHARADTLGQLDAVYSFYAPWGPPLIYSPVFVAP